MFVKKQILILLFSGLDTERSYLSYDRIYRGCGGNPGSIRMTLARLIREQEVEKIVKNGVVFFRLTSKGIAKLRLSLALSPSSPKKWDRKWRVILLLGAAFRDHKLASALKDLGFGKLRNSVYISPFEPPYNLRSSQILLLETHSISPINNGEISSFVWGLDTVSNRYTDWMKKANRKVKDLSQLTDIVSEYEAILRDDPMLPSELLPSDWPFPRCQKLLLRLLRDASSA